MTVRDGRGARGHRSGGDKISCVAAAAVLQFGPGLHPDDGDAAGQAEFAGKASIPFEPVDFTRGGDDGLLDTAVGLVEVNDST